MGAAPEDGGLSPSVEMGGCPRNGGSPQIGDMTKNLNKKIAMVIAFSDFKDEEYFIPREIFERAGVEVATVSNKSGMARGVSGAEVAVALKLDNLEVADYDGVV
ncbi:MAG: DJ-1/PfpI family protein, partial [Candidatus Portnoybacteria bacterium]|nr:DJ-1/PfpI family protein [Candidatus Portnoybacteria bacterium]